MSIQCHGFPMPFYVVEQIGGVPVALNIDTNSPIEGKAWYYGEEVGVGLRASENIQAQLTPLEPPLGWIVSQDQRITSGLVVCERACVDSTPVPHYLLADGLFYPMAYDDQGWPIEGYIRHPKNQDELVAVGKAEGSLVRTLDGTLKAGVPVHAQGGWSTDFLPAKTEDRRRFSNFRDTPRRSNLVQVTQSPPNIDVLDWPGASKMNATSDMNAHSQSVNAHTQSVDAHTQTTTTGQTQAFSTTTMTVPVSVATPVVISTMDAHSQSVDAHTPSVDAHTRSVDAHTKGVDAHTGTSSREAFPRRPCPETEESETEIVVMPLPHTRVPSSSKHRHHHRGHSKGPVYPSKDGGDSKDSAAYTFNEGPLAAHSRQTMVRPAIKSKPWFSTCCCAQ